jgi:hypothetical protein
MSDPECEIAGDEKGNFLRRPQKHAGRAEEKIVWRAGQCGGKPQRCILDSLLLIYGIFLSICAWTRITNKP